MSRRSRVSRRLDRLSEWWEFYAKYDAAVYGALLLALAFVVCMGVLAS